MPTMEDLQAVMKAMGGACNGPRTGARDNHVDSSFVDAGSAAKWATLAMNAPSGRRSWTAMANLQLAIKELKTKPWPHERPKNRRPARLVAV